MTTHLLKLIVLISITFLTNSCSTKKLEMAPPLVDNELTEYHFKKSKYKNILDYPDADKYFLLYGENEAVKLYDMKGNEQNSWETNIKRALLLKNCNLLVIENNQDESIHEKNFNGDDVWQFTSPGRAHHDLEMSDNGTIMFLYRKNLPKSFKLTNGCKHDEVEADAILEINREGEKIFEWFFHEHYGDILNKDKCTPRRRKEFHQGNYSEKLDWIHPNAINIIKNNKWYEQGYTQFKPGNIIVTPHHLSTIIIINKETGNIIWTFRGDQIPLDRPHEAKMIPEGLPGAGNILIFDNGSMRKYTRVIEINPITKKEVWSYSKPGEFYTKWAGSQQRLKNGDTFISDDNSSRAFIVNKKGEIKWQFSKENNIWSKRAHLYLKQDFMHCVKD